MPRPTPTTETTPAERISNFTNNVLPGIAGKFPAFTATQTTPSVASIVNDVKTSGAEDVPALSPDD